MSAPPAGNQVAVRACAITISNAMWCRVGKRVKTFVDLADRGSGFNDRCEVKGRDLLGGSHWLHGTPAVVTKDVSHCANLYRSHFKGQSSQADRLVHQDETVPVLL